jgi:hypothetical protein
VNRRLFACPHCNAIGATSDPYLEWFDLPELEEVQTEFDEDTYSEAPEAQPAPRTEAVAGSGDLVIRESDGNTVKVERGISNHSGRFSSGLTVETAMDGPNNGGARPNGVYGRYKMQSLTDQEVKVTRPPQKRVSNPHVESIGDDPTQDSYPGLSGQELHQEQLLQAAYEADLKNRGFSSESNFI